jgi:hypothetical protein
MEELKSQIQDFLNTVEGPLKKELKFIKENDWIHEGIRGVREKKHDLHYLITNRAVGNAEKLHKIAKDDLDHPKVKRVMKKMIEMFEIYEKRYHLYTEKEDWTTYLDQDKDEKEMEEEITLQSDISKAVTDLKGKLRKINFGGAGDEVNIELWNNTPMPFMMSQKLEDRYPEIAEKLEKKLKISKRGGKKKV